MTERVLVLGSSGFIGRHVVEALAKSDWATTVAAVRGNVSRENEGRVEYVSCDATSEDSLKQVSRGIDAVVNCVAGDARTIVANAHALGTVASSTPHSPRVVHLSSMAVYGSTQGKVAEGAPLLGDLGWYSAAKARADRILIDLGSAVILRPGIVYGPGSRLWSDRIGRLLSTRRLGDLGTAGDGICNLVFVRDMVTAILKSVRQPGIEGEAFNLSLPSPPTWNEYFVRYAKAMGAVPVRRIGRRRLAIEADLLAVPLKILEIVARRCGAQPSSLPAPIPRSLLKTFQQELQLDTSKAESILNMSWTPLEEGLTETARAGAAVS